MRIGLSPWRVLAMVLLLLVAACRAEDEGGSVATQSAGESAATTQSAGESAAATESPEATGGEATDVFDLAEGDCFSALEGEEVTQVEVVSCDAPHVFEVFHIFDHSAGGEEAYPGDEEIRSFAEEGCLEPFEQFVGTAYDESQWFLTTITPTEETWTVGDREIVCTLSLEDESEVTGSAEGSGE